MKLRTKVFVLALALPLLVSTAAWLARRPLARLFPIRHEGVVMRIGVFHKGGYSSGPEGTRQLNQFAIIFEDGFDCEATDTSFAAIREGDRIELRGYHDVRGDPVFDPEWWECDEGQLVRLVR